MSKILIKNGNLVSLDDNLNFDKLDILIEDGIIKEIAKDIETSYDIFIDAKDKIVSPGLIDVHTHVFNIKGKKGLGVDADLVGVNRGTTSVIDAGSAGPLNLDEFVEEVVNKSKTKVFSLMNVSKNGLMELKELNSLDKIDEQLVYEMVKKYPEVIVGLKTRASSSVVGELGIIPIELACKIAKNAKLPIMIHTGNFPPYIEDVLNLMGKNDVLTHAFHGKKGGLLSEKNEVIKEAIKARERGVLFDVGHGSASFSFKTFKKAKELGFYPDMVSTDIHCENFDGIVYSQHAVISKLINCGEDLATMLQKATSIPANHFKLKDLGHLKVGYVADISISSLLESEKEVEDSMGEKLLLKKVLLPYKTIISKGLESEIIDNE